MRDRNTDLGADLADRRNPPPRREPRWLTAPGAEPVRVPLTRRRIVDAALALVDDEGLPALTVRRLANELGVAPMSLYTHVADKAELVAVMVDDVVGQVVDGPSDDGDGDTAEAVASAGAGDGGWEDELRALCRRHRAAWARHHGLVRAYVDGVPPGPNSARAIERFVEVLCRSGLDRSEAEDAFAAVREYTVGSLLMADGPAAGCTYEFGLDLLVAGIRQRAD